MVLANSASSSASCLRRRTTMGVPEFFLNALPDYRRDTLEFLLCLNQYVREKEGRATNNERQSVLPPRYHSRFSPDIGDAVRYFAYKLSQKVEFAGEVNGAATVLQSEQSTEIPGVRDHVLRLANESLLSPASPFSASGVQQLGFRDFLVHFVNQFCEARNVQRGFQDKMRNAVASPAANHLRKLVDFFGLRLNQKEPKAYLKFYASVCALLLKLEGQNLNDFAFQVLGEVENVIHKYRDTFPGYVNLDNYAKFKKLLLAGKVQPMNE